VWSPLDSNEVAFNGDHTLLVRSVDSSGFHSLSVHSTFYAYGEAEEVSENFMAIIVVLGILVLGIVAITAYRNKLFVIK